MQARRYLGRASLAGAAVPLSMPSDASALFFQFPPCVLRRLQQRVLVVLHQVLRVEHALVLLVEALRMIAGDLRRHAEFDQHLLTEHQAGVERLAHRFHPHVHQRPGMSAVARVGKHLGAGIQPADRPHSAQFVLDAVDRDHEHAHVRGAGRARAGQTVPARRRRPDTRAPRQNRSDGRSAPR